MFALFQQHFLAFRPWQVEADEPSNPLDGRCAGVLLASLQASFRGISRKGTIANCKVASLVYGVKWGEETGTQEKIQNNSQQSFATYQHGQVSEYFHRQSPPQLCHCCHEPSSPPLQHKAHNLSVSTESLKSF